MRIQNKKGISNLMEILKINKNWNCKIVVIFKKYQLIKRIVFFI